MKIHPACLALLIPAAVSAQVRGISVRDFFGDFEGASLVNPQQIERNSFSLEAKSNQTYGNQGSLMTWVCAGIRIPPGQAGQGEVVRISVPNGNKIAALHAVYSYDRVTWRPVPARRRSFDFDVPLDPGQKAVYFATFYPYTLSQMLTHNRRIARSRYAKLGQIGKSVHGRDIPVLTITDPRVPETAK